MPFGDPGGNFAGTGGYGGNFGGYGGASNQSGSGGYGGTGGWGGQFGAGGYTAGLTGAGGFNANGLGNGSMYGGPGAPSLGTGWPNRAGAMLNPAAAQAQGPRRPGIAAPPPPVPPSVLPPAPPSVTPPPSYPGFNYNDWVAGPGFPTGGWMNPAPGTGYHGSSNPPGGWGSGSIGNWGGTGNYNGLLGGM